MEQYVIVKAFKCRKTSYVNYTSFGLPLFLVLRVGCKNLKSLFLLLFLVKNIPTCTFAQFLSTSQHISAVSFTAAVMREKQTYFIGNKHFVERSTLSRLNDHLYIEAYRRALSQSIAAVRECDSSESDQDMVLESDQDMVWESDQINGGEESQSQSSGFHTSNSTCSRDLVPSDSDRSSEERADCIVLDMGRGMSLLGLLAANEGMGMESWEPDHVSLIFPFAKNIDVQ